MKMKKSWVFHTTGLHLQPGSVIFIISSIICIIFSIMFWKVVWSFAPWSEQRWKWKMMCHRKSRTASSYKKQETMCRLDNGWSEKEESGRSYFSRTCICSKQEAAVIVVFPHPYYHWIGILFQDQRMSQWWSPRAFTPPDADHSLHDEAVQDVSYCTESRQERCARNHRHLLCGFTCVDTRCTYKRK